MKENLSLLRQVNSQIILIGLLLYCNFTSYSLGLKLVRDYPLTVLSNAMPWQIDVYDDWTFGATEDGLLQFNGDFSELFPAKNRMPLRSVNYSKDENRLYVGGINEFGYYLPSDLYSLEYVCLSDSIGNDKYIGNIRGIYPEDGVITLQADGSVMIYDTKTGKRNIISSESRLSSSAMINGVLWLASDNGLKFLMGNVIAPAPGTEAFRDVEVRKILEYDDSLLLVTSSGIWQYKDRELDRMRQFDEVVGKLGELSSADFSDGMLALGSHGNGLAIIDVQTGKYDIYDKESGIESNNILSLKFDDKGDLWVGMQFGLAKILLSLPVEKYHNIKGDMGFGYTMAYKNNAIWFGTNRGLFKIDYNKERNISNDLFSGFKGLEGQVWGLWAIDEDIFCCHDHGLFLLKDNSYQKIGNLTGVWEVQKLAGSPTRALVGSYFGLHTIRKTDKGWIEEGQIEGYPFNSDNFVQEAPGIVWVNNGENGVNRLQIDTAKNSVTEIKGFQKAADGTPLTRDVYISRIDNDIYFSTDNGIYIYDAGRGAIVKEKEITALLNNPGAVRRLKKTNGSIYALTPFEILQADPAGILDLQRIPINPSRVLPFYKDVFFPVDDYIGYPTRNGYLFFDFSRESQQKFGGLSPNSSIKRVSLTSLRDSVIYRGNFGAIHQEPVLKYSENSVKIEFGSYEDLQKGVVYKWRLNNEPWSAPAPLVSKEYTGLKEGNYRFEVEALSPGGQTSTSQFSFSILPPWWRSRWMVAVYIILVILAISESIILEKRIISRKQQRLLDEKNEEMAIQQKEHEKEKERLDRHILELEREKIDKEMRHKAQEVANVMMTLSHKNETLQGVKKEIKKIMGMVPSGHKEMYNALSELHGKVTVDIRSDETLKRVEEEFDIAHDNFMKKVRSRYPDLSHSEVLLCAYLKMNLSTKEISPLMNMSIRGIETMRYRVRKKMGLNREESLSGFISKLE